MRFGMGRHSAPRALQHTIIITEVLKARHSESYVDHTGFPLRAVCQSGNIRPRGSMGMGWRNAGDVTYNPHESICHSGSVHGGSGNEVQTC